MAFDFIEQSWRRVREADTLYYLPKHYGISVVAAAVASVIAHAVHVRRERAGVPIGTAGGMDLAIHFALDAADDLYNVISAARRNASHLSVKEVLFGALEASLFSNSIHNVVQGILERDETGHRNISKALGGAAGFAGTIATMGIIGGYYEHKALNDPSFVNLQIKNPTRAEKIASYIVKRTGGRHELSNVVQNLQGWDNVQLARAIGDTYAYSLASVAVGALVVAPVISSFVESLMSWTKRVTHSRSRKDQVLETAGGRKTRSMMDLPYDPGSPPNPILAAWQSVGVNARNSLIHSKMDMSHIVGDLLGHVPQQVQSVVHPVFHVDPGVDYRITLRDTPIKKISLLRKMERKMALEV